MKTFCKLSLLCILFCQSSFAQKLPEGYILQYQQSFSSNTSLSDFRFHPPVSWGIDNAGGNYYLQSERTSSSDLPSNMAIIDNKVFGDFIFEIDLMPGSDSNGYSEICLFLGMKDSTRYYCVQLTTQHDSSTYGTYLVKNSVASLLTDSLEQPVNLKENKWHKIRVERNIVKRTIIIYVDNMTRPALQIKDYELVMGMVGFGSWSSSGRFDNIKIWAPTVISDL